jgi:hypothetical protein
MTDEMKPLPGAVFLSRKIERRRFLRSTGNALFYGIATAATGAVGLTTFLADPALATGACCGSSCCGPSPCCNTSCCKKGCCAPVGGDWTCSNNGTTCRGKDYRHYPSSTGGCWSCSHCPTSTVCCDCKTNNTNNCANFTNRCICWGTIHVCGAEARKLFAAPKRAAALVGR